MTTLSVPVGGRPEGRRRGLRLTSRVFLDLAAYIVSLGLVVGLIFPPVATLLGVPEASSGRPLFHAACLVAGFMVGAMNYALCRFVVGGRMAALGSHLRSAAAVIASASRTGDWSAAVIE